MGQRLCDPGPSPTQPPLSRHKPPQWPLVGAPRTLPTCGRCGASDPLPLGGPRGPEGSPACRGQACRAGPGHSLSPVLGVMLPPNPLAGRQDAPARVPAHAHAHAGGSTHFGIGVGEVELVQTVLPRVQEAPHGQGPVSTGDRAGQDAAERAGTPRRRQQGRRGPGPTGWAPPCGLGAGRRAPLSVQPHTRNSARPPRGAPHSQRLVPQRLQLGPVLLAELLRPLGCVRRARLARHGTLHHLPRTRSAKTCRCPAHDQAAWREPRGAGPSARPSPGAGTGGGATPHPRLRPVSPDVSPHILLPRAPTLRGDRWLWTP